MQCGAVWDSLLQCGGGSEMVDGMWCDAVLCSPVQCDRMAVYVMQSIDCATV